MYIQIQQTAWNGATPLFPSLARRQAHHELLWACYLSGQMNGADLEHEIDRDPGFGTFVTEMTRADS